MLFQHDPKEPVGIWERLVEDGFGLWVEGRLISGVPRADALRRLIESRAIDGLSIGFRTVRASREATTGHRRLWQIDLWEVSIVTFPMMDAARIAPASAAADEAPAALARCGHHRFPVLRTRFSGTAAAKIQPRTIDD